jgi:hypothetical protein
MVGPSEGMRMAFFVVGGEYRDTTFREVVRPDAPEGPFEDYDDALAAWRSKSVRRIDEAYVRYRIVEADRASDAAAHVMPGADGDGRGRDVTPESA